MLRLKELRRKHNLSQDQLAELLSVSRNTYSNYERNVREMDHDVILFLADYYKVSLDYIFGRTNNPFIPELLTLDEREYVERSLDLYRDIKKIQKG